MSDKSQTNVQYAKKYDIYGPYDMCMTIPQYYLHIITFNDLILLFLSYRFDITDRDGVIELGDLLNQDEVNYFLYRIEKNFPNFVAGVITDSHGFPVASKISKKLWILENTLALSAITKKRDFIEDSKLVQIKKNLDKSKNYKLLVLLEKTKGYKSRVKSLKNLIKSQELF